VPRWIVFDQITADAIHSRMPHADVFDAPGRALVEYALDNSSSLVTLLSPAPGENPVIAVFRPSRPQPAPPVKTPPVQATGFLGLNDAPVWEEEEEQEVQEKRKWWQRRRG